MSETKRLVAIGPGTQYYGTRALVAGDEFEMPRQLADVLVLLGRARLADEKPVPPAPKVAEPPSADPAKEARYGQQDAGTADDDHVAQLRNEAIALGIEVDGSWSLEQLNRAIKRARRA